MADHCWLIHELLHSAPCTPADICAFHRAVRIQRYNNSSRPVHRPAISGIRAGFYCGKFPFCSNTQRTGSACTGTTLDLMAVFYFCSTQIAAVAHDWNRCGWVVRRFWLVARYWHFASRKMHCEGDGRCLIMKWFTGEQMINTTRSAGWVHFYWKPVLWEKITFCIISWVEFSLWFVSLVASAQTTTHRCERHLHKISALW